MDRCFWWWCADSICCRNLKELQQVCAALMEELRGVGACRHLLQVLTVGAGSELAQLKSANKTLRASNKDLQQDSARLTDTVTKSQNGRKKDKQELEVCAFSLQLHLHPAPL